MQLSIISTAFSLLAGVELCLGSLAVTFVARFQFAHGEEKKQSFGIILSFNDWCQFRSSGCT
jgi:hypothetical protein